MSKDGHGTTWHRNIAKNFNGLSRVHECYRQTNRRQTDGSATAYSEREREFTFAKKENAKCKTIELVSVHNGIKCTTNLQYFSAKIDNITIVYAFRQNRSVNVLSYFFR